MIDVIPPINNVSQILDIFTIRVKVFFCLVVKDFTVVSVQNLIECIPIRINIPFILNIINNTSCTGRLRMVDNVIIINNKRFLLKY